MTPSQILAEEMELIKRDLIIKHRELGMPASGKWIESVEANTVRLSGTILAEHYTEQLVNGRPPTSPNAAPVGLVKIIEQWIIDKGIQPMEKNLSTSTLAFLITRKIHKEGTRYFREGGTKLVEAVITPARIQRIINRVTEFQISSFSSAITGMFQQLAA